MDPCGYNGCVLPQGSSERDCEAKCNPAAGCVGVVFADGSCSGQSGPVCWTKSNMDGPGTQVPCRASCSRTGPTPTPPSPGPPSPPTPHVPACASTQCRTSGGGCPAGTQGVACTGLCSAQCGGGAMGCGCAPTAVPT
jgi:hypothetical protein